MKEYISLHSHDPQMKEYISLHSHFCVQDETSIATQYAYDKKKNEGMARPGTDRLAAVKQAYKNQFLSNFKAAESQEAGYNPNAR